MVAAVVLAVLGVADAVLFGIYTQLVFAVVLAAAAWRARDGSRTALKVMTVVAAIQGILVISFLLFSGEHPPCGGNRRRVAGSCCRRYNRVGIEGVGRGPEALGDIGSDAIARVLPP